MNQIKFLITLSFLLLLNQNLHSQIDPCGTITESYDKYEELKKDDVITSRSSYTMPIAFHIISERDNNNPTTVYDLINEVNISAPYFNAENIDIEICEINFIENSSLYNFQRSQGYDLLSAYNRPYVINVYIVGNLTDSDGYALCGLAFYPWAPIDLAIVTSSCITNGSTLAHEIGHFLGLYHTHETGYGLELVNQSNCSDAGDLLCDTPADPKLSYSNVDSDCNYIGTAMDHHGTPYQPNPELIMSYSRKSCRHTFTGIQGTIMRNTCDRYYPYYRCQNQSLDSEVIVFPNPTTDFLNIALFDTQDFELLLYDLKGSFIKKWVNKNRILLPNLHKGIYILEIIDIVTGERTSKKIMIGI